MTLARAPWLQPDLIETSQLLLNPSDTAVRPRRRLWLPVRGCPLRTPNRVSQVPGGSFCARCLLSPRGVRSVPTVVASQSGAGFTSFGRLATPIVCNEAEPSSLDATARAFASPSLSEQGRPRSLRVRLHDFRPIIMINSFHLTRTSQASLGAFRTTRTTGKTERNCCSLLNGRSFSPPSCKEFSVHNFVCSVCFVVQPGLFGVVLEGL